MSKNAERDELSGLCGCAPGGIFLQSRHIDLMEQGWHFNYCANPDSVVRFKYDGEISYSNSIILKTNSVLFNQIQTLKKLINEKGCKPDSVYKFSEKELIPENVKKGIYVVNVPVPSDGIRVPKYVRLLKVYYPNGTLFREIQFSQGLRNGFDKRYFVTGQKYIDLHYKNGLKDGVQTQYYVSGKKDFVVEFKNGKHVGIMKEYSREKGSITRKKIDEYTGFGW